MRRNDRRRDVFERPVTNRRMRRRQLFVCPKSVSDGKSRKYSHGNFVAHTEDVKMILHVRTSPTLPFTSNKCDSQPLHCWICNRCCIECPMANPSSHVAEVRTSPWRTAAATAIFPPNASQPIVCHTCSLYSSDKKKRGFFSRCHSTSPMACFWA